MPIFAKLGLGFGAVLTLFALTGGLVLWNLRLMRATDGHVRDRVAFNEIALEYRHAAADANLGAGQFAAGNVMGEQRIREGTAGMAHSRDLLKSRLTSQADQRELLELERIEN